MQVYRNINLFCTVLLNLVKVVLLLLKHLDNWYLKQSVLLDMFFCAIVYNFKGRQLSCQCSSGSLGEGNSSQTYNTYSPYVCCRHQKHMLYMHYTHRHKINYRTLEISK